MKYQSSKKTLEDEDQSSKSTKIQIHWRDLIPFFPQLKKSKLQSIQMTKECLYSSTHIIHSEYMKDIIKQFYPEENHHQLIVTDATSCIGGTFMAMVKPFGKINAVEINPIHSEIMYNNIQTIFGDLSKKVTIINDNYLSVWDAIKSNIIIIDPPWGGLDYTKKTSLKLYLDDKKGNPIELMDIVNMVLSKTEIVMVRVPYNYDMKRTEDVACKFSKKFRFIKKNPKRKAKTSYFIYVFSNILPEKDLSHIDENNYISHVSYRKISYVEL